MSNSHAPGPWRSPGGSSKHPPPSSTDGVLWNQLQACFSQSSLRSGSLLQELLDEAKKAERLLLCFRRDHWKEQAKHGSPQRENQKRNEKKSAFQLIHQNNEVSGTRGEEQEFTGFILKGRKPPRDAEVISYGPGQTPTEQNKWQVRPESSKTCSIQCLVLLL